MKQFLFLIILPLPLAIFGQDCDCTSNFEWAKKTFEENDAGFQFAIDNKGKMAYEQHNTLFKEKISKIENADECAKIIYEWLTFFRSGHIAIRSIDKKPSQQKEKQRNEGVIDGFKDWERMDIDFPQFQDYLKGKIENDFEGIWVSAPYQFEGTLVYESYEIGIKKVGNEYIGFVIEADGANRTKGQIKLRIKKDLSATYYMQDLSVKDFEWCRFGFV